MKRPIPEGFAEDAKVMPQYMLAKKYHAGVFTIWCWCSELGILPSPPGRKPNKLIQLNPETLEPVRVWNGASEAATFFNGSRYHLNHAASEGRLAYGWRWKYEEDEE